MTALALDRLEESQRRSANIYLKIVEGSWDPGLMLFNDTHGRQILCGDHREDDCAKPSNSCTTLHREIHEIKMVNSSALDGIFDRAQQPKKVHLWENPVKVAGIRARSFIGTLVSGLPTSFGGV